MICTTRGGCTCPACIVWDIVTPASGHTTVSIPIHAFLTQWLVQQPSHVTVLPGVHCVRPTGGAPARSVGPVIHIGVARRGPQAGSRVRVRKRADSPPYVPHLSWSPTCLAAPRESPRLAAP